MDPTTRAFALAVLIAAGHALAYVDRRRQSRGVVAAASVIVHEELAEAASPSGPAGP